jgi:hypothetical protein
MLHICQPPWRRHVKKMHTGGGRRLGRSALKETAGPGKRERQEIGGGRRRVKRNLFPIEDLFRGNW